MQDPGAAMQCQRGGARRLNSHGVRTHFLPPGVTYTTVRSAKLVRTSTSKADALVKMVVSGVAEEKENPFHSGTRIEEKVRGGWWIVGICVIRLYQKQRVLSSATFTQGENLHTHEGVAGALVKVKMVAYLFQIILLLSYSYHHSVKFRISQKFQILLRHNCIYPWTDHFLFF